MQLEKPSSSRCEIGGSKVGRITGDPGKSVEDERVAVGFVLCAGQRPDQVGSSPTDARVRGVISKSGGNASLAGVS